MTEISNPQQFVQWFRHSSPYINAHRGRTFVIHIAGDVVAREDFNNLVHDLALLNSLGVRLVLVHGAQQQIDTKLAEAGIETQRVNGLRVTNTSVLPYVQEASALVRMNIEAQLSMGVANSPMAGARIRVVGGNMVTAKPIGVVDGVDFLHTGMVRRIDVEAIQHHLEDNAIVLLSPIGYSPTGEIFSLTAEDVATAAAVQLKADKLMTFIDAPGLTSPAGEVINQITLSAAHDLFHDMSDEHPYASQIRNALYACEHGVRRVHFMNQNTPGALLVELFSRDGAGTLITSDAYDTMRAATIDDVGGILELITPLEQEGVLVRRSRELLEMEIRHFTVMERDGMIIGCAAIYPFAGEKLAEMACFAIHPDYQNAGRGDLLLNHIESSAATKGIDKLFVLTSRTAHWFQERGFNAGDLDQLPVEKRELYNYQRRSKIFIKKLTPEGPAA